MNDLTLTIVFMDDTTETVVRVDETTVVNGVLNAWRQGVFREQLGHWPIVNIRKWTATDR